MRFWIFGEVFSNGVLIIFGNNFFGFELLFLLRARPPLPAFPSPLVFRHGPARIPLLSPLPPLLRAAVAAPSPPAQPRLPRRARRSRESAFGGGCCFEEVQIIQEQCETGLQDWECSHFSCCI
ncbi:hypothetical protein ACJX0J_031265, partial [Zea mays]